MEFFNKAYSELSKDELYEILQLRAQVFVVEQDCVYQDVDGKDSIANHIFIKEDEIIIGYARIFGPGDYFKYASIGRVVVHPDHRGQNSGNIVINLCVKAIYDLYGTEDVQISAQNHLKKFYERHGFEKRGKIYLEDGIKHISMKI
ncbi:MAG: GNAT family N-acetyltransferase [Flavobacteriaceae bacterium]|nr:MAG: GNAT family N-acetyltransferase [Flavobacteriaceae bacterium]